MVRNTYSMLLEKKEKIESINKTEIIIGDQQIDLTRTYAEAIFNNLINKHLIQ